MLFKEHHESTYITNWAWNLSDIDNDAANLHFFYKIVNGLAAKYLAQYLNINDNRVYKTRASEYSNIKRFATKTEIFKQSFFYLSVLINWCELDI